ncbi:MAG: hypothetical protein JJU34_10225 [Lunatimonas sp.]|uniref:hypothetical protein n=1 Tax=Lunatimonas sp. TaxID=2060141 RepID=UPI00263BD0B9|nr:hypothetical protein [Lunatimonas sp.]MCC5937649.1 hypothetical protein [Lunatimonas sp.]
MSKKWKLFFLVFALYSNASNAQETKLWRAVEDKVYLQEKSTVIPTTRPVQQVAIHENKIFALIDNRICQLTDKIFEPIPQSPSGLAKLKTLGDQLVAFGPGGLYRLEGSSWRKLDNKPIVDVCMHLSKPHAATKDDIFVLENDKLVNIMPEGGYLSSDITMVMEDGTQLLADPVKLGPITAIESYAGTLHILRPGKLVQLAGAIVNEHLIDWGNLPSNNTQEMLSVGSRLLISTDRGLGVLRGASMSGIKGADGLPVENTQQLVRGFAGDVWIGTPRGAIRMVGKDWHYFGADHWLPDNQVNGIAVGDHAVYIATDKGLGVISYEPYTLLKKADHYEKWLDHWGHKRLGFIHTLYDYEGEWVREISDNDGSHTASYLTGMSYKYAVTGDETARKEASEAFEAMLWLERITPIDGLIARSIWSRQGDKGRMGKRGSGGLPAKWNATADSLWYWKGDASSDEIIAHFYSVSLFHDLAADAREKELAKEHMRRIAGYIMDNGWVLIDYDGQPTRWGRWNPEYLLRPYGWEDRGVNGLEALAFSYATYALTGEERFKQGYQQLIDWGYAQNTIRQKKTFPPSEIAPWDDNLAFEAYNTLLRYEKDPARRSVYLRSLERTYEIKRMEQIPWFNFSYAAFTGNDAELDEAVQHLREWTLDCIEHNYQNSHRDDLFVAPGYTSYEGGLKAISPREKSVMRGARRAIVLDGGVNGKRIMEPVGFLRDYWMGRYYGFIQAPEATETDLIRVDASWMTEQGAKPYVGPKRPNF